MAAARKNYQEEWWDRDKIAKLDRVLGKEHARAEKDYDFERKLWVIVDYGEDADDGHHRIGTAVQAAKAHCEKGTGYIDPAEPSMREAAVLVNSDTAEVMVYRCQHNALIRSDWRPRVNGSQRKQPKPGWTGIYRLGVNRNPPFSGRLGGGRRRQSRAAEAERSAFLVR
jgi:hypothetical protein